MGQLDNIDWLKEKMHILEEIVFYTEVQKHYVKQRKMTGLARVLDERAELIKKLAATNDELANDQSWKGKAELAEIIAQINNLEQQILECSRQAIQVAISERMCIAAEIRGSKAQRQVRTQYVNPWAIVARGRRINEKG